MGDNENDEVTLKRIKELKGNDSQSAFAKKIHTTQSNVCKMLQGTPPSAATLKSLSTEYHVSVDWLLGLSEKKEIGESVRSHDITSSNITYADAMAVLEILYQKECLQVGYEPSGYDDGPNPGIIWVRDKVLRYYLDSRLRYSDGSRNIYDIWLADALERYGKRKIFSWTDYVDTAFEQNISNPPKDEEILDLLKLLEGVFNGVVEPDEVVKKDGFMNISDELPFN